MAEIFVVSSGRVLATCQGCTCYLLFCRTIACNFSSKWRQVFISPDFLCHSTAFQAWLRVAPSEEAMTAAEFARTKMHLGHNKVVPQVKQNDIRIWQSRIEFQSPPLKAGACARSSWSFGHVADLAGRVEVTTACDSYRSEPCWIHLGTVGCVSTFHGRIATWMPFGAGQCCNPMPGERTCKTRLNNLSESYRQGELSEAAKAELSALPHSQRADLLQELRRFLIHIWSTSARLILQIHCSQNFGGMKNEHGWTHWTERISSCRHWAQLLSLWWSWRRMVDLHSW